MGKTGGDKIPKQSGDETNAKQRHNHLINNLDRPLIEVHMYFHTPKKSA
jgi:hypothetical protein